MTVYVDELRAEVERLTAALKIANDQTETFERGWYLRGDEIERLGKDAERYRFLRGSDTQRYLVVYAFRTDIDEVCLGDELDAAIDDALENAHD